MDNTSGSPANTGALSNTGVSLERLLLALDRTVVTLRTDPSSGRPLDVRVAGVVLVDVDDLRLGLGRDVRGAQLLMFVGVPDDAIVAWLDRDVVPGTAESGTPAAAILQIPASRIAVLMVKAPSEAVLARAASAGIAVIAVDPHARWERLYHLVSRVVDAESAGEIAGVGAQSPSGGDLFDLAAEVARRTGGLVSIEDEHSHVLAYSSAGDEADELRRLSILGREGPADMLAWLRRWGVMDALRTSAEVIEVAARPELELRARRAVAIRTPGAPGVLGDFLGVVWLQRGERPLAGDTDDVLAGAAAVAARVIVRRRAIGTEHDDTVRRLLGAYGETIDTAELARRLTLGEHGRFVVIAFGERRDRTDDSAGAGAGAGPDAPGRDSAGQELGRQELGGRERAGRDFGWQGIGGREVTALTLHASAFSPLSVTTTIGARAYVVVPQGNSGTPAHAGIDPVVRWARAAVTATAAQFSMAIRAVIAGPGTGLAAVPEIRAQADRVLDAADRSAGLPDEVTTVDHSRSPVVLGEILTHLAEHPDLIDQRVAALVRDDPDTGLASSLSAYLDAFGDVRAAAEYLHVHPNTLRYRLRRVVEVSGIDLDDPVTRLVVELSLRALRR